MSGSVKDWLLRQIDEMIAFCQRQRAPTKGGVVHLRRIVKDLEAAKREVQEDSSTAVEHVQDALWEASEYLLDIR